MATGCADPIVHIEYRVPYVDPILFAQDPQPKLKAGPATWTDLLLFGYEAIGWGKACYAKNTGIKDVLDEAGTPLPEKHEE